MSIDTLSNAELEEMGLPTPCDCRFMTSVAHGGTVCNECPECGFYEEYEEEPCSL